MKNELVRTAVVIAAAFVIAVVANGFAGRERKLLLPGYYPDPYRIPTGQKRPTTASATLAPVTASAPATVPAATATSVPIPATATVVTPSAPPLTATTATTAPSTSSVAPAAAKPAAAAAPVPAAVPEGNVMDRFPAHPDKAYVEISGADAAWLHAKGALFLDARRTSVFEQGHIAGARPFPVWESDIDDRVNALFNERSTPDEQAQPLVVYCSGGACEDSHMLAQKLWGVQFNNVLVYKDGFPDWQKRNGAVRSGKQ